MDADERLVQAPRVERVAEFARDERASLAFGTVVDESGAQLLRLRDLPELQLFERQGRSPDELVVRAPGRFVVDVAQ